MPEHLLCVRFLRPDASFNLGSILGAQIHGDTPKQVRWVMHKTLLVFALLHSVFQSQICLLLQEFLDFCFCIPVPYNEKDIFFGC